MVRNIRGGSTSKMMKCWCTDSAAGVGGALSMLLSSRAPRKARDTPLCLHSLCNCLIVFKCVGVIIFGGHLGGLWPPVLPALGGWDVMGEKPNCMSRFAKGGGVPLTGKRIAASGAQHVIRGPCEAHIFRFCE